MHTVDPWRFTGRFLTNLFQGQIEAADEQRDIPWTKPRVPVAEAKVALVSSAGISMRGDPPFDMDGERRRPTWGDPSWRRIREDAKPDDVAVNHLHIDTGYAERDLNVALPLDRLRELVAAREVGASASSHYAFMGYQGSSGDALVSESAPEIAQAMRDERVDIALLAPV